MTRRAPELRGQAWALLDLRRLVSLDRADPTARAPLFQAGEPLDVPLAGGVSLTVRPSVPRA